MPGRRHAALAVTLGLAAWLAAACGTDAPTVDLGGGCTLASDCKAPFICAFQRCHQQCDSDRDCSAGERCVRSDGEGNVCQLPSERDCERTTDCPAGQICAVDLECRNACDGDKDCTPGEICVDATCAKPSEIGPGGKLPQKAGGDGAPCRYTSECETPRVCTHNECVYQCLGDHDCPIDLTCVDNACEPVEPVCIPGQQRSCEPCGIKTCEDGVWGHCSQDGCGGNGGGGNGGSGPGSGTGGASTTSGPGSGGATTTTSGPGATTSGVGGASTSSSSSGATTSSAGGATSSSTSGATSTTGAAGASSSSTTVTTTTGIGGATASSSATVTTGSVGGSTASSTGVMSTGTSCMPCADAGIMGGVGGDPHPRLLCCP